MSRNAFSALEAEIQSIHDLAMALDLLSWDQQCIMPVAANDQRAKQIETLSVLIHERKTSDDMGALLERSADEVSDAAHDSYEASLVRVMRRIYDLDRRVPTELEGRIAQAEAEGFATWRDARAANDFAAFLPVLERQIALRKEYIACFDPTDSPYDVLLDKFEEGATVAQIDPIFDRLKPRLIELTKAVAAKQRQRPRRDAVRRLPERRAGATFGGHRRHAWRHRIELAGGRNDSSIPAELWHARYSAGDPV